MLDKVLGAGLIIAACAGVGWQAAGNLARRPRELRALQVALGVLETEVAYGASPLPEALLHAAAAVEGSIGRLFARTAEYLSTGGGITPGDALRQALAEMAPDTALRAIDTETLVALSAVLGASDRKDQTRHLSLARQRLAGEEGRAAEERMRYERVYRYIGVLSGVALVLILL